MTEKQIQNALNGKKNIFLTGPAGTGKSTLIQNYIDTHENVLVTAPTGIAALHIGGETLHKVFNIPIPAFEAPSFAKSNRKAVKPSTLKTIAAADTLIIDEISMCRADVFAYVYKVLKKAEKLKGQKIKLIVCGDFSQLPPVVSKEDEKLLKKFKFHSSGYAFTTKEWNQAKFKVIALEKIYRQDNKEFITCLNEIRIGNKRHIDYFNQFVQMDYEANPETFYVCGTNAEAERFNTNYLNTLTTTPEILQADKTGRTSKSLVDDLIIVKPGCKIIFTANDVEHGMYQNGSFGIFIRKQEDGGLLIESNGQMITLYRKDHPIYTYRVTNGVLEKKEIGNVRQYPIKIGKAITIHKSQGQTFDKAVISPSIFAAGQLYVALSRVKSPDGLILLNQVEDKHIIVDPAVKKFYRQDFSWEK